MPIDGVIEAGNTARSPTIDKHTLHDNVASLATPTRRKKGARRSSLFDMKLEEIKNELQKKLNIKFDKKNLIFVFHPVNSLINKSENDLKEILKAIKTLKNTSIFATYSGLENGAERFIKILKKP